MATIKTARSAETGQEIHAVVTDNGIEFRTNPTHNGSAEKMWRDTDIEIPLNFDIPKPAHLARLNEAAQNYQASRTGVAKALFDKTDLADSMGLEHYSQIEDDDILMQQSK